MAYEVDPELPGAFDPDDIEQRDFALSRRGFDPAAVRAFLAAVADEQRALRQRTLGAELQVADLLGRLDDADARREEAEARVAVLERELTDVRAEAALRAAADEAELRSHHDAVARARAEVAALEQRLVAADTGVPEALAALVADALPGADDAASIGDETARVLSAAHEAADAIRARALADASRFEAAARELAQRVVHDAEDEAAAVLAAARADAAAVVADARKEAQREAEQAAAVADSLVADASRARRVLLEQLTARRRRLRHQVEQLQAARDRLLDVLGAAAATLDEVRADVDLALPAAREAASAVVEPDVDEVAAEVAAAVPFAAPTREGEGGEPVPAPDGIHDHDPCAGARTEGSVPVTAGPGAPTKLFDRLRRAAADGPGGDPVVRQVARRLKKVLTDEQNDLLDRVCRSRRLPEVSDVLPDAERRRQALVDAAGALGSDRAEAVAARLADPLGARVEAALTTAVDGDAAAQHLRAVYREWRDERVPAALRAVPATPPPHDDPRRP